MDDQNLNPYEPPTDIGDSTFVDVPKPDDVKQVTLANALARWTLICAVAAAPSFFLGLSVAQHPLGIPMMLLGVATFAIVYAFIDVGPRWRRWMSQRLTRNCILWTYGIRIAASVIYPIGVGNDMLFGVVSMGIVNALSTLFLTSENVANGINNPVQILLTTILQGIMLNGEIFAGVLCLMGATSLFHSAQDTMHRRKN